jgi:DNA polymerase-1
LQKSPIWTLWRRRFGQKANVGSKPQLGKIIYDELKYEATVFTDKGKPAVDIVALEKFDDPFFKAFTKIEKMKKAVGTYLKGIRKEVVKDRLHCVFNLHTTATYRSSSDSPNFQNMPVRDPDQAHLIRNCFIPSEGRVLVENDYAGIEVKIAACYHKDKVMLSYIKDPTKDMHRDMAAQIYMLEPDWVKANGKQHRYGAKNKFVFPVFYGDFYPSCAKALWEWIERGDLRCPKGRPLKEHLAERGITKLGKCNPDESPKPGSFEKHIQEVENDFWNNRFQAYGRWKKQWYSDYLNNGGFDTFTGFRITGTMKKNQVSNYPVQGSAFHCLLWSLIKINKILRKRKMKSRVAGQIHDSIIGDVVIEELSEYLDIVKDVMTHRIRKVWKWIIVPLDIEVEITPSVGTWHDKQVIEYDNGVYKWSPVKGEPPVTFDNPKAFIKQLDKQHLKKKAT